MANVDDEIKALKTQLALLKMQTPNISGALNLATSFAGDDDKTAANELEMFF